MWRNVVLGKWVTFPTELTLTGVTIVTDHKTRGKAGDNLQNIPPKALSLSSLRLRLFRVTMLKH